MLFCLDSCPQGDTATVLLSREEGVVVFNLESRLDTNYAHKATCWRSTSGGVVSCADSLLIVFLLDSGMHYAFVYGNGVWPVRSVKFFTRVCKETC